MSDNNIWTDEWPSGTDRRVFAATGPVLESFAETTAVTFDSWLR
jgi:hypothetical protein